MWSPSLKAYYNTIEKIFTDILLRKKRNFIIPLPLQIISLVS